MSRAPRALKTRLLHTQHGAEAPTGVSPVLDRSTTFRLDHDAERALATREGHDRFDVYGRFGTSTTRDAAALVAELEGAEAAILFSSGMGAISSSLLALAEPGRPLAVASDVYGGTEGFVATELAARGTQILRFDAAQPATLEAAIAAHEGPAPSVVVCESISNPLLKVADVRGVSEVAHTHGALVCVDATFAAGIAQRPLELGADVAMHSATKFLNGHSDVIAGAVAARAELVDRIFRTMSHLGSCIDPTGAWLLARGMRTLPLRFAQQCASTDALAAKLEAHEKVGKVFHPSLASHPTHALAQSQLARAGAVLSFELADGDAAMLFARSLQLCAFAVSLGGVETLVAIPRRSSHVGLSPEHWDGLGIREGLVRVAVGLEDQDDLWADMSAALERV